MFDLGVMRCNAVKYLTTFRNTVHADMTRAQIEDLTTELVEDRGDIYKFALEFVHGFYDRYCQDYDLDDLDLLCAYDDAKEFLPKWFLEKFITKYISELDCYQEFGLLDFAFASMLGKKVCPDFEHKFTVYFWDFYVQFKYDVHEIYQNYQEIVCCDDDDNEIE